MENIILEIAKNCNTKLDPKFVEAVSKLMVPNVAIDREKLAKYDFKAPLKPRKQLKHSSYKQIPKFYYEPPGPRDEIRRVLRKESLALFLQQKSKEVLSAEELGEFWIKLKQHVTFTTSKEDRVIDYADYVKLKNDVSEKCRKYLTARLFAQLLCEAPHPACVDIVHIYGCLIKLAWLLQCRVGLTFYDEVGQGYLREFEMESYIKDLIPMLVCVQNSLIPSFQKFYLVTAVKKFFFFLDPMRTGRIRIRDILASGMLDELLVLRKIPTEKAGSEKKNWFSMASVLSVFGNYLNLDVDQNGLLSKSELGGYGSGTLSSVFLDRVFEELPSYDGEMDYKTFVPFVLAMENRKSKPALQYIFRMLDMNHVGYLTTQTLHYFFRGIEEQLLRRNLEPICFHDMNNEIFDMVKPKDPSKITFKDLIKSGKAETVVSILIEFHKFWAYENRDANPQYADATESSGNNTEVIAAATLNEI